MATLILGSGTREVRSQLRRSLPVEAPTRLGPLTVRHASRRTMVFRTFARNRLAVLGALLLVGTTAATVAAPLLVPYDPTTQNLRDLLSPPTSGHLLGTDNLGRDNLTRLVYGGRLTILAAVVAVAIGAVFGTILGLVGGFYGRAIDLVTGRFVDILFAFPGLLLAMSIIAAFGPGLVNVMVAVGIWAIPTYARVVRGEVISLKQRDFVEAARSVGAKDLRIIRNHILANSLAPLIVLTTLSTASAILATAGLSFLGMGAQPPTPEWGAMLADARNYMRVEPQLSIYPGVAIIVVVLALNFVGDGLRDALDPRLR
jgi:peptide/nickel transport system permease protein